MKNVFVAIIAVLGVSLYYGGKHIAHVKCVESALDTHCKKSYNGYQKVESVDAKWWNPVNSDCYNCTAKVAFADGVKDITFTAKEATLIDCTKDDWEADFGFWGWIGEDYRILNVKAK